MPNDAIPARLASLGLIERRNDAGVAFITPPVCAVPAGMFLMGSDHKNAHISEKPQCPIIVATFEIGGYPVTVAEYARAVAAGAVPVPEAPNDNRDYLDLQRFTWAEQQQRPDHPVVCVTWDNARDYCHWLAQVTGQPWRLPTEAEWEKAARWDDAKSHARRYPWGDRWNPTRANVGDERMTTPVGSYAVKGDASPYGAHDMAGNVYEWTSTFWFWKPPYTARYEHDEPTAPHVLRGGSWSEGQWAARTANRYCASWSDANIGRGFRVARGWVK